MNKILELLLEGAHTAIERALRKAFEAGRSFENEVGPDFETWLAEEKRKARGE